MIDILPKYILAFIALVAFQGILFDNIMLTTLDIQPFVFLLFLLLLPFETPKGLLLVLGFFLGLSVDIFSDTIGVHASATVFAALARPAILANLSGRQGYESGAQPRLSSLGLLWFAKYTISIILIHNIVYYFAEAFTFSLWLKTMWKIIGGTILSSIFIIISQFFVFKN